MLSGDTPRSAGLLEPELLRKLERLAIVAKRVQLGTSKGERRSKRKGSSVEFADYRDYVQGDDLRHVDWNIVGRLDALYLKLFEEQEDLTVHLLIDSSRSMAFGTPPKLEFACRLAAAIGYIALVGFDRVSVETFSGADVRRMVPCRGKSSARKLFSFLESIEPGGATELEPACRSHMLRVHTKGVTVLISDFFDEAGFEGPLRRLIQTKSDPYAIHVMAPEEVNPEISGDLRLLDSETDNFVEISVSAALLKRYARNRDGFCEAIRSYCVARQIGYFFAPSDTPIETLALDFLRQGGMIR